MNATRKDRLTWQDWALPCVLLFTGLLLVGFDLSGLVPLARIQHLWPTAFILTGLVELVPAGEARR